MQKLWKIFTTGFIISFLGSLPLGTLNVAAMQLSISDGINAAILFSLGSLTAEIIYVRLSLIAMDWVRQQKKLFKMLEWLTLLIVVALAVSSFYAALHPKIHKNIILSSTLNKYLLGLFMSAVNPVQIPFWFGWSTVLFTKKILLPKNSNYNIYIIGIGIGTLLGNFVFIFGGKIIANSIKSNQSILSWVIGFIFSITAIIQLWKIFKHKDAQNDMEHPEEMTKKFKNTLDEIQNH
ncbi:MAG TPA: LysE family transporter [Flavisolibacter sp.]|jgi:threonine/homoserine/homoserine lactone efflux protein|nr:LysE family transporter [Flavisolibacter sp.]